MNNAEVMAKNQSDINETDILVLKTRFKNVEKQSDLIIKIVSTNIFVNGAILIGLVITVFK